MTYCYIIRDNMTNKIIIENASEEVAASVLSVTTDELRNNTGAKPYFIGIYKVFRRVISNKYPIELQEEWDRVCAMFKKAKKKEKENEQHE